MINFSRTILLHEVIKNGNRNECIYNVKYKMLTLISAECIQVHMTANLIGSGETLHCYVQHHLFPILQYLKHRPAKAVRFLQTQYFVDWSKCGAGTEFDVLG
jgi:hypothetical protein